MSMQRWILAGLLMIGFPLTASTAEQATTAKAEKHGYKEIHTGALKDWYDQGKNIIVLDARAKESFNEAHLMNSKSLPYDARDKEIQNIIPSKDTVVVTYCWNEGCPISEVLADRLSALGYKNVYKYPEGIEEWTSKGYPVSK